VSNLRAIAGRIVFEKGKQKCLNLLIDISTSAHSLLWKAFWTRNNPDQQKQLDKQIIRTNC